MPRIHQHIETLRSSRCAVQSSHRTEQYLMWTIDFLTRYEYCCYCCHLITVHSFESTEYLLVWCFVKWSLFELPSHNETWRGEIFWNKSYTHLCASAFITPGCCEHRRAPGGSTRAFIPLWAAEEPNCSSGNSSIQVRLAGYVCAIDSGLAIDIGNNTSGTKTAESGGHSRADRGCGAAAARAPQEGSWISPNAAAGWGDRTLPTRFLFLKRPYSYPNLVLPTQKSYVFRQNKPNKHSWRFHAYV